MARQTLRIVSTTRSTVSFTAAPGGPVVFPDFSPPIDMAPPDAGPESNVADERIRRQIESLIRAGLLQR